MKSSISQIRMEPEKNVLYVVGTPIGNLNDISARAIRILNEVSLIACEDTRQTIKLMNKYGISNNLVSFNKENSFKKTTQLIQNLQEGKSLALVSDAGMPSICDPGEELVKKAKSVGINVICIPGPCAAITALVSSGFPSSRFIFEGFLPKRKIDRDKILLEISKSEKTTVLFESPHRLKKLLEELKEFCGGKKEIHVSRELTKKFEEHISNNIDGVINFFQNKEVLGELTVIVKGNTEQKSNKINELHLKKELHELVNAGLSLSAASKFLAKKKKLAKSVIYNLYK